MTMVRLPTFSDIQRLSRLVDGYPASREEFIWAGQAAGLGSPMIDFLQIFSEDMVFFNEDDFTAQSQELIHLLRLAQSPAAERSENRGD